MSKVATLAHTTGDREAPAAYERAAYARFITQQLIEGALLAAVCVQLKDALARTDGAVPPPDFVTGPATPFLATEIEDLLSHLPCGS